MTKPATKKNMNSDHSFPGEEPKPAGGRSFFVLISVVFLFANSIFGQIVSKDNALQRQPQRQESKKKQRKTTGGTYIADEGGDLDMLMERAPDKDAEGRFVVHVKGKLPQASASLSLYSFDIDEERGEKVKVYLNGNYLGNLSGTNDTWNTTVFDVLPEWIRKGDNTVRYVISDGSKSGRIKWSSKIAWGQLLIDGGAGDEGIIAFQILDSKIVKDAIVSHSRVNIETFVSGTFKIEITLVDPNGNAVAANQKEFRLKNKQKVNELIRLESPKDISSGNYQIVSSLFYKSAKMWVQQDIEINSIVYNNKTGFVIPKLIFNPIQTIEVDEDSPPTRLDLSRLFSLTVGKNPITYPLIVTTKEIVSNSAEYLVSTDISDDTMVLTYQKDRSGDAELTIQGTYKNRSQNGVLRIRVVGHRLDVANPIPNVSVDEDSPSTRLDLSEVFSVFARKKKLKIPAFAVKKSVLSNSNIQLTVADISHDTLVLTYQPDVSGDAEIAIRGTYKNRSKDAIFRIRVVGHRIGVANPIQDVLVDEDSPSSRLDLSRVFALEAGKKELKDPSIPITKEILSNSNTRLVAADISTDALVLNFGPDSSGEATIVIRGTYKDRTVDDAFSVAVTEIDDRTILANPIPNMVVKENAPNTRIDLSRVFLDIDDPIIEKSVLANSNGELLSASIVENTLVLDYLENQAGKSTIVIRGTARGKTVDDTFTVTVLGFELRLTNPIRDIYVDEDSPSTRLDLSSVFTVVQGNSEVKSPAATVGKRILSNSGREWIRADVSGDVLKLNYRPDRSGNATIVLRGTFGRQTLEDTFSVAVDEIDDGPILANPIADVLVRENSPDTRIDLSAVFSDIDDPIIKKTVLSNSNGDLVSASIVGNSLVLKYQENQVGRVKIVVRGTASGKTADDNFRVTVKPDKVKTESSAIASEEPVRILFHAFLGLQRLSDYDSSLVMGIDLGRELNGILNGLSGELELTRTLSKHTATFIRAGSHLSSEINATTYSLFIAYCLYCQTPSPYDLFAGNPLRVRMRLGFSAVDFNEESISADTGMALIDEEEKEGKADTSFGLNIGSVTTTSSEFSFDITRINSEISNLSLGYRFYF